MVTQTQRRKKGPAPRPDSLRALGLSGISVDEATRVTIRRYAQEHGMTIAAFMRELARRMEVLEHEPIQAPPQPKHGSGTLADAIRRFMGAGTDHDARISVPPALYKVLTADPSLERKVAGIARRGITPLVALWMTMGLGDALPQEDKARVEAVKVLLAEKLSPELQAIRDRLERELDELLRRTANEINQLPPIAEGNARA